MLFAFLDDVNLREYGWHARGGLIIDGDQLPLLERRFAEVLKRFGVPIDDEKIDCELKWSPNRGNWIRENIVDPQRADLHCEVLALLDEFDARAIACVFNYGKINSNDWTIDRAKRESFVYAFERIQVFAKWSEQPVIVVIDNEDDEKTTKRLVDDTLQIISDGSDFVEMTQIYQHAWSADSKHHAGIQIADLITAVTTSMVSGADTYAKLRWPSLKGRFVYLENNKSPQRYGISIIPSWHYPDFLRRCSPYRKG